MQSGSFESTALEVSIVYSNVVVNENRPLSAKLFETDGLAE